MSSTTPANGPMLALLNKALDEMKRVDAAIWLAGEIGVKPEYLQYGIPENCSESIAFSLMHSYCDDIKRKKQLLVLLEDSGIEGAMKELLEEVM